MIDLHLWQSAKKTHSSPGGDDARCNTSPVVQLCTFCSKTGVSFGTCTLPFSTARCSSRTRLLSPVQSSPVWYHCCLIPRNFSRSTQSQLIWQTVKSRFSLDKYNLGNPSNSHPKNQECVGIVDLVYHILQYCTCLIYILKQMMLAWVNKN